MKRMSRAKVEFVVGMACVALSLAFYCTQGFGLMNARVRSTLADYQWGELKKIAIEISRAKSDEEGLEIAKKYHLCRDDGTLDPNARKTVTFADGTGMQDVRIIGFRHDAKSGSENPAGITFCFVGPVDFVEANATEPGVSSNVGGWEGSSLRSHVGEYRGEQVLNDDKIPKELGRCITTVEKLTNNAGGKDEEAVPTVTEDRCFALSYEEVFGSDVLKGTAHVVENVTAGEGSQYQYFAEFLATPPAKPVEDTDLGDAEGTEEGTEEVAHAFAEESYPLWLRSPSCSDPDSFVAMLGDRRAAFSASSNAMNVVVGFCL